MAAIYDLLRETWRMGPHTPEYWAKYMHAVPSARVVRRTEYILERVRGRVVLDVGCGGPFHAEVEKAAAKTYGLDILPQPGVANFMQVNLDSAVHLPPLFDLELVVAGEVIEHLSNAGHFLELLREYRRPVLLTTPNAFSEAGLAQLRRGYENVNAEHVAWYSYHTLRVLVERHGFRVAEWRWYNGKPLVAEGIVFYLE